MGVSFLRFCGHRTLLISMSLLILALGISSLIPSHVSADGPAETSFSWDLLPTLQSISAPIHNIAWSSHLQWDDAYYDNATLDGVAVGWDSVAADYTHLAGSAALVTTTTGEHQFCITTMSRDSAPSLQHCLHFMTAGDGQINVAEAEAQAESLAEGDAQDAFIECVINVSGPEGAVVDFCNRSAADFKAEVKNWYQCRYVAARMFGINYSNQAGIELRCGAKPVYVSPFGGIIPNDPPAEELPPPDERLG